MRYIKLDLDDEYEYSYNVYAFKICSLCKKAKEENKDFDNSRCPHCKTRYIGGFSESKDKDMQLTPFVPE